MASLEEITAALEQRLGGTVDHIGGDHKGLRFLVRHDAGSTSVVISRQKIRDAVDVTELVEKAVGNGS